MRTETFHVRPVAEFYPVRVGRVVEMNSSSMTHLRILERCLGPVRRVCWQRCCSPSTGRAHHVRRTEGGNHYGR